MSPNGPKGQQATQARSTRSSVQPIYFVLICLIAFRVVNALCIRTFFQPDEYFQSLEPAWQSAFGPESGAWITWEWREHLRSSAHPILFSAAYRVAANICNFLNLKPEAQAEVYIAGPKLLQAGIAAAGDWYTWRLAGEVYDHESKSHWYALALTVLSPWQWYCSVRTFSNSLETSLTVMGLFYWPWHWWLKSTGDAHDQNAKQNVASAASLRVSLMAAAIACIFRPTNIIIWAAIALTSLYRYGTLSKLQSLVLNVLESGVAVLVPSIGVDRFFYGQWAFPPLKFLYFNVVQSLSVFYGRNRFDYYLTEGLPLLLLTALPFALLGLMSALRPDSVNRKPVPYYEQQISFVLAVAVCVMVTAMTSIAHKEMRFIYPLLPILHALAAKQITGFIEHFAFGTRQVRIAVIGVLIAINIFIAYYVSVVHQRGVIDVIRYLRHEQETRLATLLPGADNRNITVGFLMPCHSTPWRSHLVHPEIQAWALTCEPPLNTTFEQRGTYLDEADVFYQDPEAWLKWTKGGMDGGLGKHESALLSTIEKRQLTEYLVFFEQLEPTVGKVLGGTGYHECWRAFNTHWHDDWRRQGDIVVWCLR
ncbi:glycosyltransferase family 22 protein [Teratosphaeria destructans]|uniref:Mannosyltransferase n=1 Tax=Teratosphaeria destructans TaxID=418781 RepID=A0A9W7SXA0_9PEZI|nr:glycosyltransferase family 22 protein [Teratosphaeria destructans]